MEGRAIVDGKVACQATLTCAVVLRESEKTEVDTASEGQPKTESETA